MPAELGDLEQAFRAEVGVDDDTNGETVHFEFTVLFKFLAF